MKQIVDLQRDEKFRASNVEVLSIAVDPITVLAKDVQRLGITAPVLSDEAKAVSKRYGIPLTHGGEPGHVFVLIDKDARVRWYRDYGGRMYVAPDELYAEVSQKLR